MPKYKGLFYWFGRIRFVGVWFLFAFGLWGTAFTARAESHVRVAAATLPAARGNPFFATSVPSVWTYASIYDALTQFNENGQLSPALATSWESLTPTLWRVELRRGVTFSNGEVFDGGAVVETLRYLQSPEGQASAVARVLNTVTSAYLEEPHVVLIETATPDPILPRKLTTLRIPAPQRFREVGLEAFSGAPVGTGPFKVDAWRSGRIDLSAHGSAWRPAQADRLTFLLIQDQAARMQALLSGGVDIAFSLNPDDRDLLVASGGSLVADKGGANLVIAFRTGIETPVKDSSVRIALNYAVNKEAMVALLMGGESEVASQFVPSNVPGFDPTLAPYPYDPDHARRLLAEAGYADGFDMDIDLSIAGGSNANAVYSMVASDLRKVGVNARLNVNTNAEIIRRLYQGGWSGAAFVMVTESLPALDPLAPFRIFSCEWIAPFHCDEEAMPLIRSARQELDAGKRLDMIRTLLRRTHVDPPVLYLFHLVNFTGVTGHIDGFASDYGIIRYHALTAETSPLQ